MRLVVVAVLTSVGCGRVGFDATDSGSGDGLVTDGVVDRCGIADLALYYSFDETTGSIVHDGSGNGHDVTALATIAWVAGRRNGALRFDGANTRVVLDSAAELADLPAISVCAWMFSKPLTNSPFAAIVDKSLDGLDEGWNFYLRKDTGTFGLFVPTNAFEEAGSWQPQTWMYLCGTWDGSPDTGGLHLYQDDALQPPDVVRVGGGRRTDVAHTLTVGRAANGEYPFDGDIDELRIYRRALSATEIAALRACSS